MPAKKETKKPKIASSFTRSSSTSLPPPKMNTSNSSIQPKQSSLSSSSSSSSRQGPPPSLDKRRLEVNQRLLAAAERGDLELCKQLLNPPKNAAVEGGDDQPVLAADAWFEDSSNLGWSSLHFAAENGNVKLVRLLLRSGAIWNAVDSLGNTAADIAWSRNHEKAYKAIFDEGVRQTLLLNLLKRKNEDSADADDGVQGSEEEAAAETGMNEDGDQGKVISSGEGNLTLAPPTNDLANSNKDFLKSRLEFFRDEEDKMRCLDQDGNMVMADWESNIMQRSAELICKDQKPGFSALNVGFGLGIVDKFIQSYKPSRHVIIEAHPDALAYMRSQGWDKVPGVEIFEGRWEDWIKDSDAEEDVEKMLKLGSFDAVYWDTYSQDYNDLRRFFECLPNLLTGPEARFSFFHGLAATNAFLYDVYTRVSELDLKDIGLVTEWEEVVPDITEETWRGVKRKYWDLDSYRLPLCRLEF
ncbi:S-adenosyl-L-methionine-dependent methyltransferase [Violaceomyces palustris]|uniref:S-adenosyl-L-methionine-dependent methyltransferase n=1 Tax=Violaceomyces palustris TaxID=1673888 RepID=A0ACD0P816_9BASI|nr:S-adenosyl-L-methionine-dependent methyltransferase [Violaceomyces palustris]